MLDYKDHIRLRHMLDYSREALHLIDGRERKDLDQYRNLEPSLGAFARNHW